jgi:hypothetical protein
MLKTSDAGRKVSFEFTLGPSKEEPGKQALCCVGCKGELQKAQLALLRAVAQSQADAKAKESTEGASGEPAKPVAAPQFSTSASKGGGCFVATAAFGSAPQPEVEFLRRFRDERLARFAAGRAFIRAYNSFGPPLAAAVRRSRAMRALSRAAIRAACALLLRLDGAKLRTAENSNSEV